MKDMKYFVEKTLEMDLKTMEFVKDVALVEDAKFSAEACQELWDEGFAVTDKLMDSKNRLNRRLALFNSKYGFTYSEYKEAKQKTIDKQIEESLKIIKDCENAINEVEAWEYSMVNDDEVHWGSQSWDL